LKTGNITASEEFKSTSQGNHEETKLTPRSELGIAIFSAGTTIGTQCQTAYIVDAYPEYTASALAAISVMKSFAGFGFPLFAPQMYKMLDYGWGNTLIAGVSILLGVPMPWVLWKYGARIRARAAAS